ncbi:MAG TPA: LysR family transcriptional regulator [Stellaceae bacterium]|nr:LysR family transcriptional regulator [Stellaceae bacterium]
MPAGHLPSLKALRAFSAVAAEGSFERAAERLGVSRSAVSHLISDLEHQLGVSVLERSRRGVRLTHDGTALLLSMGDAIQRIEAAIESFRRDRNQIRLSTVATFASCWLLPRLPDLQTQHPHLRLSLSTTVRAVDFSTEDFDCGIRHGIGPWPDLECTLLFTEALVLVGLPELIGKIADRDLGPAIRSIPIIQARSRPHDLRRWWQGAGLHGCLPRSSLVVENREQALAGAVAGAGLTLIDPKYVEPPSPMSILAKLPGKVIPLHEGYFFVVPSRNRGRKNVNLLGSWLAFEAHRLA